HFNPSSPCAGLSRISTSSIPEIVFGDSSMFETTDQTTSGGASTVIEASTFTLDHLDGLLADTTCRTLPPAREILPCSVRFLGGVRNMARTAYSVLTVLSPCDLAAGHGIFHPDGAPGRLPRAARPRRGSQLCCISPGAR